MIDLPITRPVRVTIAVIDILALIAHIFTNNSTIYTSKLRDILDSFICEILLAIAVDKLYIVLARSLYTSLPWWSWSAVVVVVVLVFRIQKKMKFWCSDLSLSRAVSDDYLNLFTIN